ncbi:MAG: hypothetical protein ABL995_18880 [Bryobacteraceae bacterium]
MIDSTESFTQLPGTLRRWISYERELLDRGRDWSRCNPDYTNLPEKFTAEGSGIFRIPAFWLPEKHVQVFNELEAPELLEPQYIRVRNGQREVLYLLHPALRDDFSRLAGSMGCLDRSLQLLGITTASERTLLVWSNSGKCDPFFAKLSLPFQIGGVDRTISPTIASRSVGTSSILRLSEPLMPATFGFLPEVLAVSPRDKRLGSLIVRPVPASILSGERCLVPMFALYAKRTGRAPLLRRVARKCGLTDRECVQIHILRAFAQQWLDLVLDGGFIPEAHAQNLLLETDNSLAPTGRLIHRDLEGFYVDLDFRAKAGLPVPKWLPKARGLLENYNQKPHRWSSRLQRSLYNYFQGGLLFNFENVLPRGRPSPQESFEVEFQEELCKQLHKRVEVHIDPASNSFHEDLVNAILDHRSFQGEGLQANLPLSVK